MILQMASWLYGAALARLIARVLIEKFGVNLFPRITEMLMPAELGVAKSADLLIFGGSIAIAGLVYGINFWAKKSKNRSSGWLDFGFLLFSFLFFWQVWFSPTTMSITLVIAVVMELIYLGLIFWLDEQKIKSDFPWQYAILAGYWLMTVTILFSTSLLLSLNMFVLAFALYAVLSSRKELKKILNSPIQLLFLATLFLPLDKNLIWIGVLIIGGSLAWGKWIKKEVRVNWARDAVIVVLVTYNPLFYVGNYDFVEEGVWLGWLQRLNLGQVAYRDFWMYQPPLILNFVHWVMQIWGTSLFSVRLGLQLLRVLGLVFYFYLVKQVLEGKLARILLFAIAIGISSMMVRNNVEIRLGVSFLAIAYWYKYIKSGINHWLVGSGVVTALAALTSLEMGVGVAISMFAVILLFEQNKKKQLYLWLFGGSLIAIPLSLWMLIKGVLLPAISQVLFYSRAFSAGYFNSPVPIPPESSYLQWSLLDEYLSSQTIGWELAKFGLLLGIFLVIKNVIEKKAFDEKGKLITALVIFELIVFRGALGRSDWYHLSFALLPAMMILAVAMEKALGKTKTSLVLGLLLIVFARENGFRAYVSELTVNWQTHGQVFEETYEYDFVRGKILAEGDMGISGLNQLVTYVKKETKPEEKIFAFPWLPDLYFFADRENPTKNDIPYSFFSNDYQELTIAQLKSNPDAIIVISSQRNFGGLDSSSLELLNQYIQENYVVTDRFDVIEILKKI